MDKKAFKKLQAKWYAKLKKSGFQDIEASEDSGGYLKSSPVQDLRRRFKNMSLESVNAKIDYFNLAGQFLHDNQFQNNLEEEIWRLHAEGHTVRDISKILLKDKKKLVKIIHEKIPASFNTVLNIIHKIKKEMLKKIKND